MSSKPSSELGNKYQKQYQASLARATLVCANQQVSLFIAGLSEDLRVDVELQNPPNLATPMNLARAWQKKQQIRQSLEPRPASSIWPALKPSTTSKTASTGREGRGPASGTPTDQVMEVCPLPSSNISAEQKWLRGRPNDFALIVMKLILSVTAANIYSGLRWMSHIG